MSDPIARTVTQQSPTTDYTAVEAALLPTVTADATAVPLSECPQAAPEVPGYEIEAVLGRGGMGVVYRARHLALKRTVALKMILAGVHAGERERARFKAEAEAVARLQHPGIVQIHEIGEHAGHPFCALEFVAGGSLADKLAGKPLVPNEAARLIEALARAMHLAHSRNVVHRDLKPANVLLTTEGQPKVTDFGLARQLDEDSDRTREGAVLGTPSYMAPEQAAGRGHEAGPAADIWALGAILYECLTGQPPFKGATMTETLEQVRTHEPVAPRSLNRAVPRDLEVICLACLRKEPERRYASALELAKELARFLRGEPIQARPAGRLERAGRWIARNPALALALTAAVTFLVAGAGVAWWLAAVAIADKQAAVAEKDKYVGMTAKSSILALATQNDPLTAREVAILSGMASQRGKPLARRYLLEAIGDPELTPMLRVRGAYLWQAVLGLDRRQRDEAERLLLAELRAATGEHQIDLAWGALSLGGLAAETATSVADVLRAVFDRTADAPDQKKLTQALAVLIVRMEPAAARATCDRIADRLNRELTQSRNPGILRTLTQALAILADVMEPGAAARVCTTGATTLARLFTPTANQAALRPLAQTLPLLVAHMSPTEAAALLVPLLGKSSDLSVLRDLGEALRVVADRLTRREASEAAAGILAVFRQTRPDSDRAGLLAALAIRTDRSKGLALRREIAARLLQAIVPTSAAHVLNSVASVLSDVVAGLPANEAAALRASAITALLAEMARPSRKEAVPDFVMGVTMLTAEAEPEVVRRVAAAITRVIRETTDDSIALRILGRELAALTAEVNAPTARAACADAIATLNRLQEQNPDRVGVEYIAMALTDLAPRMDAPAATAVGQTLLRIFRQTQPSAIWGIDAACLATVAERMDPDVGQSLCAQVAALLLEAIRKPGNRGATQDAGKGLAALASWLSPRDLEAASTELIAALRRPENAQAMPMLSEDVARIAARLPPGEARRASQLAAAVVLQAMNKSTDPIDLASLIQGIGFLAPWLGPKEATALAIAQGKTAEPGVVQPIRQAIGAILAREAPSQTWQRPGVTAGLVGQGAIWSWLTAAGAFPALAPEQPAPLPAQVLVDLLRNPVYVGPARRPVLDQLARHYDRTFADRWDFVAFAEQHHLGLDLLGASPRP